MRTMRKKVASVQIFEKYLQVELNHEKEIERLYLENPLDEIQLRDPPKFKFIPSDLFMKCLIVRYVESTLF